MGLKVWLPLNGDLTQQGTSNVSVTNTSAVVNTAGKIGSCYSFGTAKSYLKFDDVNFIHDFTECSVSLWLKIISWNTSYATYFQFGKGSTPWAHYIFGLLRNNAASTLCFTISNGSSATNANYLTPTLDLNTWYHLTFTYTPGHCRIYVNGAQTNDYNATIVPNFAQITTGTIGIANNVSNYQTNCLMNDFRVYDHCLSAAEVKEISQGLVLHYKLDDMSSTIVEDSSGYNHNGTRVGTISAYTDSPRYSQCMNLSAAASRINCGRGGMVTDAITVNFWANLPTVPSALSDTTGFVSCAESGGFRIQIGNNAIVRTIIYINSAYVLIEGTTAIQADTWYMITLVYDRMNSKLYEYINGIKDAEVDIANNKIIGYNSGNVLWIGAEARSGTSYYSAIAEKVSDFRIYCTALDADAIRQLYEVGAKIDNKNNIHAYEFNEFGTNQLTKSGVFKDTLNEETVSHAQVRDGNLYAENFIEA